MPALNTTDLNDLYQELILDHSQHPTQQGVLEDANCCHEGHNPLCGDKITVYLKKTGNLVQAAQFEGEGCAISIASASLMMEAVTKKSLQEIETLFDSFHGWLLEGKDTPYDYLGKLVVFAGVKQFPIRVKCVTLCWHTLLAALASRE